MKTCHACGETWDGSPGIQPGCNELCEKCGADLHCCLNCRFYDAAAYRQCRSKTVELVKDKDKKNFCDEFEFAADKPDGGRGFSTGDMQKKWDDLFKS